MEFDALVGFGFLQSNKFVCCGRVAKSPCPSQRTSTICQNVVITRECASELDDSVTATGSQRGCSTYCEKCCKDNSVSVRFLASQRKKERYDVCWKEGSKMTGQKLYRMIHNIVCLHLVGFSKNEDSITSRGVG